MKFSYLKIGALIGFIIGVCCILYVPICNFRYEKWLQTQPEKMVELYRHWNGPFDGSIRCLVPMMPTNIITASINSSLNTMQTSPSVFLYTAYFLHLLIF